MADALLQTPALRPEQLRPTVSGYRHTKAERILFLTDSLQSVVIDKSRYGVIDLLMPVIFATAVSATFKVGFDPAEMVLLTGLTWTFADGLTFDDTARMATFPYMQIILNAVEAAGAKSIDVGMLS